LFIIDLSNGFTTEDSSIIAWIEKLPNKKVITIENKCDLIRETYDRRGGHFRDDVDPIRVSALTGHGFDSLKERLYSLATAGNGSPPEKSVTVANDRHVNCLRKSLTGLSSAMSAIKDGQTGEAVASDLRAACQSLGEIVGEVTSDEVLNNI